MCVRSEKLQEEVSVVERVEGGRGVPLESCRQDSIASETGTTQLPRHPQDLRSVVALTWTNRMWEDCPMKVFEECSLDSQKPHPVVVHPPMVYRARECLIE